MLWSSSAAAWRATAHAKTVEFSLEAQLRPCCTCGTGKAYGLKRSKEGTRLHKQKDPEAQWSRFKKICTRDFFNLSRHLASSSVLCWSWRSRRSKIGWQCCSQSDWSLALSLVSKETWLAVAGRLDPGFRPPRFCCQRSTRSAKWLKSTKILPKAGGDYVFWGGSIALDLTN